MLNIATIIIAVCAVILTSYQVFSTNYHNRISSLPLIQSGVAILEDGGIMLYFENAGNGPAIVTGFEAAGEKVVSVRPLITDFLKHNNLKGKEVSLLTTELSARMIIKAGDQLAIATLYPKNTDSESYKAIAFIIESLPVTLCYISLYQDELYVTTSQKYVRDDSCAFEGATNILGTWIKFKMPFSSKVDQSKIFGN
ncbi:hypothetical protein FM037_02955 [Shewanella psychropiezotolerans]|uniref:Uncharacterized protein n=1 Tax=Shewanella psychropiezotolerans TaxID=2593655 RepID=A0ABX5WTG2_9GAMM|nr:hypothetical protein [Shewanella psychropiezotolerans]QDO82390.1 hypothetical protein FM037_02955 [Shewanella psychropiezotolerans]